MLSCHFLVTGVFSCGRCEQGPRQPWKGNFHAVPSSFFYILKSFWSDLCEPVFPGTHRLESVHRAAGQVWETERQQARFGFWPCEVYFHTANSDSTAAVSDRTIQPELTPARHHYYCSHNDKVTSVLFIHTGKSGLHQRSFQNSLRATHLCPRADILITIPPTRSVGEGGMCTE